MKAYNFTILASLSKGADSNLSNEIGEYKLTMIASMPGDTTLRIVKRLSENYLIKVLNGWTSVFYKGKDNDLFNEVVDIVKGASEYYEIYREVV